MTVGRSQVPYRCFAKVFCTWSPGERLLRLGRIVWRRGELMAGGYTAQLSIALTPRIIDWERGYHRLAITILGVRLNYQRAYGGWHT